jgi:hypothetical protein
MGKARLRRDETLSRCQRFTRPNTGVSPLKNGIYLFLSNRPPPGRYRPRAFRPPGAKRPDHGRDWRAYIPYGLIRNLTPGPLRRRVNIRTRDACGGLHCTARRRPRGARRRVTPPHASAPFGQKKARRTRGGSERPTRGKRPGGRAAYFCHVRFLWRFDFKRFRRLCLFIFRRRFFFRLPMVCAKIGCDGRTVRSHLRAVKR